MIFKTFNSIVNEADEQSGNFSFEVTVSVPTKVNVTIQAQAEGEQSTSEVALTKLKQSLQSKYGKEVKYTVDKSERK